MADGGSCSLKSALQCVNCCRTADSDGYLEFSKTLTQYVCSDSPCKTSCQGFCQGGDVAPACAGCILAPPLSTSVVVQVKNTCASVKNLLCANWGSCVEGCL